MTAQIPIDRGRIVVGGAGAAVAIVSLYVLITVSSSIPNAVAAFGLVAGSLWVAWSIGLRSPWLGTNQGDVLWDTLQSPWIVEGAEGRMFDEPGSSRWQSRILGEDDRAILDEFVVSSAAEASPDRFKFGFLSDSFGDAAIDALLASPTPIDGKVLLPMLSGQIDRSLRIGLYELRPEVHRLHSELPTSLPAEILLNYVTYVVHREKMVPRFVRAARLIIALTDAVRTMSGQVAFGQADVARLIGATKWVTAAIVNDE